MKWLNLTFKNMVCYECSVLNLCELLMFIQGRFLNYSYMHVKKQIEGLRELIVCIWNFPSFESA